MLDQADEHLLNGLALPRVAQHDRDLGAKAQCDPDVFRLEPRSAVKAVDGDDEGRAVPLEVVDGGEAVGNPSRVSEYHGTQRADRQLVPHEPETLLPGSAEQVKHKSRVDAKPAEVLAN